MEMPVRHREELSARYGPFPLPAGSPVFAEMEDTGGDENA